MTGWHRFGIGGTGALLPVLVSLLAVDLAYIIDHFREYTLGIYVGTALRYMLLFILGGVVAALNSDERKPIKLVQLGIAAPALVASYMNAQVAPRQVKAESIGFISVANAKDAKRSVEAAIVLAGNADRFIRDLGTGLGGARTLSDHFGNTLPSFESPSISINPSLESPLIEPLTVPADRLNIQKSGSGIHKNSRGRWEPDDGCQWINNDQNDLRVRCK